MINVDRALTTILRQSMQELATHDVILPDDPPLIRSVQYVVLDGGSGDDEVVTIGPWRTKAEANAWAVAHATGIVIPFWHPVHWTEQTGE